MGNSVTRVGIVDDHAGMAESLAITLEREPGIEIAWIVGSIAAARLALDGSDVDFLLLNARLPDGSGLEPLSSWRAGRPAFFVLSCFEHPQYAARFEQGADGNLLKLAASAEIGRAVREATDGHLAFGARRPKAARNPRALTRRQLEVVRLVAEGLSNDEIAGRLHISRKTVEAHLACLYARVDLLWLDHVVSSQLLGGPHKPGDIAKPKATLRSQEGR